MNALNNLKKESCKLWYTNNLFIKSFVLSILILTGIQSTVVAQTTEYSKPSWWFGVAGAANFNFYRGSTQQLNAALTVPVAFHDGNGTGFYAAPLIEYHRPGTVLGVMLQGGYDSRKGKFKQVITPCNCPADLSTDLSYITIEPSLVLAPFKSGFYLFAGPRFAFNMKKSFTYQLGTNPDIPAQVKSPEVKGDFDNIKKTQISAQAGLGYDILLSSKYKQTQAVLSPFVAFQPYFGQSPRSTETWNITTVRAGAALKFGTGRRISAPTVVPPPVVIIKDRDGDGVLDDDDRCPDIAGLAALKGCPDRDGDGIADIDDKCPDVFGYARYQGCPIPDRDKDGINDEVDKCPDVFGYARYQGCPIPDTDKDGVNDEEDKCINIPGPASNFGCPVIPEAIIQKVNLAAKNVFFATGSAKLLAKSFGPLKTVAQILNDNPTFKINVEGHTDSTGKHDMNMKLSDDRAASVAGYLKSVGVDESRITSEGYGPDRPIAPNKTTAGRAKNRRVEMKLRNY